MRRSELDPRLVELATRLFVGARDVLAVSLYGSRAEAPNASTDAPLRGLHVTRADDTEQLRSFPRRHDAALWRLGADTSVARAGTSAIRKVLLPGAPVLLAVEKRPPALDQLRAVFTREPLPRASLESLCEALLLSGFAAPRVHDVLPGWLLVSARLPATLCALDDFFEQPAHPNTR